MLSSGMASLVLGIDSDLSVLMPAPSPLLSSWSRTKRFANGNRRRHHLVLAATSGIRWSHRLAVRAMAEGYALIATLWLDYLRMRVAGAFGIVIWSIWAPNAYTPVIKNE